MSIKQQTTNNKQPVHDGTNCNRLQLQRTANGGGDRYEYSLTFFCFLSFMFQMVKGGGITKVLPVAAAKATPHSRLRRMLLKPPRSFWRVTYLLPFSSARGFRYDQSLGQGGDTRSDARVVTGRLGKLSAAAG